MGTFKSRDGNLFAVVHHQTPRGVKVTLTGAAYDTLIIGTEDPEGHAKLKKPRTVEARCNHPSLPDYHPQQQDGVNSDNLKNNAAGFIPRARVLWLASSFHIIMIFAEMVGLSS